MTKIKWHLHTKIVENRVNLYCDSVKDERVILKVNKHHKQLWLE